MLVRGGRRIQCLVEWILLNVCPAQLAKRPASPWDAVAFRSERKLGMAQSTEPRTGSRRATWSTSASGTAAGGTCDSTAVIGRRAADASRKQFLVPHDDVFARHRTQGSQPSDYGLHGLPIATWPLTRTTFSTGQ